MFPILSVFSCAGHPSTVLSFSPLDSPSLRTPFSPLPTLFHMFVQSCEMSSGVVLVCLVVFIAKTVQTQIWAPWTSCETPASLGGQLMDS